MGEAKRRQAAREDAYAEGRSFRPIPECPACRSREVKRLPKDELPLKVREAFDCGDLEICLACEAIWEAFPADGFAEDPVCAEPCDNCAFRPGSPEQKHKAGWRSMIDKLRPGHNPMGDERFYCHKGVPIDMSKGPGNFLFPQRQVLLDGEPVTNRDGSPVLTWDVGRMRVCSGYLRMLWALRDKRELEAGKSG